MLNDVDAWRRRKQFIRMRQSRRLAVVDTGGRGPAALLLHGYTDTSRSYQALGGYLGGHPGAFRLIIPDLPGHGDSDEDPEVDFPTLVEDMLTLAAALDCVPSLVIGHSFGSLLALELACRKIWSDTRIVLLAGTARPSLGRLTLLDPIRGFEHQVNPLDPFLDHWYEGPVALDSGFLARVRSDAVRMPVRVWHRYLDLLEKADLRSALGCIRNPLLAVSGEHDILFNHPHTDLLRRELPHADIVRLADCGHNPHWEAPEHVSRLIAHWLDRVAAGQSPDEGSESAAE